MNTDNNQSPTTSQSSPTNKSQQQHQPSTPPPPTTTNNTATTNTAATTSTTTPQPKDEILEKLLSKEELQETVQGVWSFFSNPVSQALEKTKVFAETIKTKAQETLADNNASTSTSSSTTTTTNNTTTSTTPLAPLPWENVAVEFRPEAKARILKLSMEDRTFVVPPPTDAKYSTNVEQRAALAKRMLEADPLLAAKRFKLVPKSVDEASFWLNYFYRVDIILEAVGASANAPPPSSPSAAATTTAAATAATTVDENNKSSNTPSSLSHATNKNSTSTPTPTTTTNNTSIVVEDSQLRDEEETFDLVDDVEVEFDGEEGDVGDLERRIQEELGT
jgi:hypothetical protein